ncbi:ABC transporter ATP-binding protein [Halosimplex marinum]|uniref:ABC transporter ATP-binding protein n=1 Tax=Halosimplex marinum TaxID=3396620 RepID=UPI003F54535F
MSETTARNGTDGTADNPLAGLMKRYARPYAGQFGLGLVAVLLARIPQHAPAFVIGQAFDSVLLGDRAYALPGVPGAWIPEERVAQLWLTVGILVAAVAARNALDWLGSWFNNRGSLAMLHDIRTDAFDAATELRMGYHDDEQTGEVMSVVHNDVDNLVGVVGAFYSAVSYSAQVVVAFGFMALLNWQLAALLVVFPAVVAVASRFYARVLEPRHEAVRESVGDLNARLEDTLDGISTVKAFSREDHERDRVADASATYRRRNWETIRMRLRFDFGTWTTSTFMTVTIFLVGGYWVAAGPPAFLGGSFTAGSLLTFLMYANGFMSPVRDLAVDVVDSYEDALASSKRVDGLLSSDDRREADDDAPELTVTEGAVDYDAVSFGYDDETTVEDVDFTVEPGELVGIVGSTGAGKSTLVKLLFRFYELDAGTIRIDGQDIGEVRLDSLRSRLGYVSQDPFLFDGTVRENVAYASPETAREEVVEAAKLAGAHEFVTDLPEGYDTEVGERGVKLSGGQRQRVAIARALVRDPPVLVFDEATSHVDNETELRIQQSLDALAADRTTFAIAHRLSTVRDADRILVVDDGRLVAEGTHAELLERDGIYADLWRVQVGNYGAVSEGFVAGQEGDE